MYMRFAVGIFGKEQRSRSLPNRFTALVHCSICFSVNWGRACSPLSMAPCPDARQYTYVHHYRQPPPPRFFQHIFPPKCCMICHIDCIPKPIVYMILYCMYGNNYAIFWVHNTNNYTQSYSCLLCSCVRMRCAAFFLSMNKFRLNRAKS